ncbi:MAG: glycerophosphodiester phosphodiesterase [Sphingomonas bacterium]|nr:glycerophosphodiester phosphodiesterase [Sphingomonas bacterium]
MSFDIDRRGLGRLASGLAVGALFAGRGVAADVTMSAVEPPFPVFGHRGSSALRPEHTLASYAKAIADGADFIEPDLVPTKDGVLVARHENNIAGTTDVARHPEFAARKARKTIDGAVQEGWFTEDFTLAELKTLRAIERLSKVRPQNAAFDGQFDIPTWYEVIDFAAAESAARGRTIGLIPEIKHSTYFRGIGLPSEERFVESLGAHAYTQRAPIEVQSFEVGNLKWLRAKIGRPANIKLFQLVTGQGGGPIDAGGKLSYADMMTPAGLADVARYADVLGPDTRAVIPLGADGRLARPSTLVADAHKAGLLVRPWTFRPENHFLAADFRNDAGDAARNPEGSIAEMRAYLAAGIDGFFTDDPGLGRIAVDAYLASRAKRT